MKVIYEVQDRIARITINRPEAMNAMDAEVYAELSKAWIDVRDNPEVWVAIVTGAGEKAFTAGADLKSMIPRQREKADFWLTQKDMILNRGLEVWKPVIAAVNGYCLAGGLELALGCDIRIASTTAAFGCPEVRWAILHGFGAMRLPQTVGMSVAMEMLLTGERITAARAYEIGLVSRVVEPAALLPTAEQIAQKISANGPLAIKITKELAWRGLHEHPDDMLRFYAAVTALIHETEDAKEGPRAFSEKRTPTFENR